MKKTIIIYLLCLAFAVNSVAAVSTKRVEWYFKPSPDGGRPSAPAEAHFMLTDGEEVISAFAYCNLHGLWVTECFPNNRKHG